jgi:hypothetical protein
MLQLEAEWRRWILVGGFLYDAESLRLVMDELRKCGDVVRTASSSSRWICVR